MSWDSDDSSIARVRVWARGATGSVLVLSNAALVDIEDVSSARCVIGDPANPSSLTSQTAARAQQDLTRFLARIFGHESPLFKSPKVFGETLDQVIIERTAVSGPSVGSGMKTPWVLDVGCGRIDGLRTSANGRRTGIDIWPALESANSHYRQIMLDGRFPVDDGEFDAVRCLFVIEHTADLSLFLAEISRSLRPGGVAAMVTTHCPTHEDAEAVGLSLGHFRDFTSIERRGPAWLFSLRALRASLEAVDLDVESTRGSRIVQPSCSLVWCELREGHDSVAEQLWITARKRDTH